MNNKMNNEKNDAMNKAHRQDNEQANQEAAFYQEANYLSWKERLDAKAEAGKQELLDIVKKTSSSTGNNGFSRILDIGTGAGSQVRQSIDEGLAANGATIIATDTDGKTMSESVSQYRAWAQEKGYALEEVSVDDRDENDKHAVYVFNLSDTKGKSYLIKGFKESVYEHGTASSSVQGLFDLITGRSVIEHTDNERVAPVMANLLKDGGVLYLPVNYDGITEFSPTEHEDLQDEQNLMALFNYVAIDKQSGIGIEGGNSKSATVFPAAAAKHGFSLVGKEDASWTMQPIYGDKNNKYHPLEENTLKMFVGSFCGLFEEASPELKEQFDVTDEYVEQWKVERKDQLAVDELQFYCLNRSLLLRKE